MTRHPIVVMESILPSEVRKTIQLVSSSACEDINSFSRETLKTRGRRIGSGMGTLLEALWGYWVNDALEEEDSDAANCEIAWLSHQYNDFACVPKDSDWDSADRETELFRVEAKSMILSADESKGHFDELVQNLTPNDLLLVLFWEWKEVDEYRVSPIIVDHFISPALPVARFRDDLHKARGGSFVDRANCPDGCDPNECCHHGEPLNANGKRERVDGPETRKPANSSFGNNFGGLVRMLATSGDEAREVFREWRAQNDHVHRYVSFVYRHKPSRQSSQYLADEWRKVAKHAGVQGADSLNKSKLTEKVRNNVDDYQSLLRRLLDPSGMGPLSG